MKKILDIKIIRNKKKRTLRMNQSHYLNEILNELHMNANKHEKIKFWMNVSKLFQHFQNLTVIPRKNQSFIMEDKER